MAGGAFGCYIDRQGLERLSKYKYVSVGSTPIDRLMGPFWNAVVNRIPLSLSVSWCVRCPLFRCVPVCCLLLLLLFSPLCCCCCCCSSLLAAVVGEPEFVDSVGVCIDFGMHGVDLHLHADSQRGPSFLGLLGKPYSSLPLPGNLLLLLSPHTRAAVSLLQQLLLSLYCSVCSCCLLIAAAAAVASLRLVPFPHNSSSCCCLLVAAAAYSSSCCCLFDAAAVPPSPLAVWALLLLLWFSTSLALPQQGGAWVCSIDCCRCCSLAAAAGLLLLLQTLDAVDGKQARRTNTSTPLGQLFDHGCDSFSTDLPVLRWSTCVDFTLLPLWLLLLLLLLLALLPLPVSADAAAPAVLQVFAALSVLGTYVHPSASAAAAAAAFWWELHFHEYRCHTGVTGVTEGQLVMMGMNLVGLVFGSEIFTTSLSDVVPPSLLGTLPRYLLSLPIQAFLAYPFYLLLIGMLTADVINGCRQAERPGKAACTYTPTHALNSLAVFCMSSCKFPSIAPFKETYRLCKRRSCCTSAAFADAAVAVAAAVVVAAAMMEEHPVLSTNSSSSSSNSSSSSSSNSSSSSSSNSSSSSSSKAAAKQQQQQQQQHEECSMHAFMRFMEFYPIQWPVIPFWVCCLWLYLTSPAGSGLAAFMLPEMVQQQLQQKGASEYGFAVLVGVLLWSVLYVFDFLLSTVSVICCHFHIKCFGVGEKAHSKKQ
ncbi:hypothetical protein Emed_002420 [Eimeria media]